MENRKCQKCFKRYKRAIGDSYSYCSRCDRSGSENQASPPAYYDPFNTSSGYESSPSYDYSAPDSSNDYSGGGGGFGGGGSSGEW